MNTQNSPPLHKPSEESLQAEEFLRYLKTNHRYFIAGNRLFVWISEKRCYEYMTKAGAMTWMDSLIDPSYDGKVRSSALEETYKKLLRDSSHTKSPKALLNEGQYYLNLNNGVLNLRNMNLLTGKEAEAKAAELCFTYRLDFNFIETAELQSAPVFCSFLETSLDGSEDNPKAVLLLEIMGTCLSSLKSVRKMFFLVGATKSGNGSPSTEYIPKTGRTTLNLKSTTASTLANPRRFCLRMYLQFRRLRRLTDTFRIMYRSRGHILPTISPPTTISGISSIRKSGSIKTAITVQTVRGTQIFLFLNCHRNRNAK